MANQLKIQSATYHRNGIGGVGFVAVRFTFREGRRNVKALATVFDCSDDERFSGYCAVMTEGDPTETWRGDHFEEQLREFIKSPAGQSMMFPHLTRAMGAA